jgi:hypothetical protein
MTQAGVASGAPATRDRTAVFQLLSSRLPTVIQQVFDAHDWAQADLDGIFLDCTLRLDHRYPDQLGRSESIASVDLGKVLRQRNDQRLPPILSDVAAQSLPTPAESTPDTPPWSLRPRSRPESPRQTAQDADDRPVKRRKATGGLRIHANALTSSGNQAHNSVRRLESDSRVFPQRKKALPENPVFQPSSLHKFVNGVWESIFSNIKMDPVEVIEQWQALESSGQPRLLTADGELTTREASIAPGSMIFKSFSILARKISQTSRTCRSLEVLVQARWMQLFDERVVELTNNMSKEKAKKATMAEACLDFKWSEKELRNKTAIWRGYADIQQAGGYAALIFAGMGLYRFCKYRVSFSDETFHTLRGLKHRFEVAADTLHPNWRQLLAIVNGPTERRYTGHPHDYVVTGPGNEAIPLPETYHQWDKDFSYVHLDQSSIDEDAWGLYDPRVICPANMPLARTCQVCKEQQSDDPTTNSCNCFSSLYPPCLAGNMPVQVYRTPNGRNNGLIACLRFERGSAIGEFVGQVTSGLTNMDLMVGQTENASYQIWQGRQGNHTRFVNHSCSPNSQFERFVWMGTQRIVLVSKGVEAGEEVTVDYTDVSSLLSNTIGWLMLMLVTDILEGMC